MGSKYVYKKKFVFPFWFPSDSFYLSKCHKLLNLKLYFYNLKILVVILHGTYTPLIFNILKFITYNPYKRCYNSYFKCVQTNINYYNNNNA